MKQFSIFECFKFSMIFLTILSIAMVLNSIQDNSINSFAQKSPFGDELPRFEGSENSEVIDDPDAGGEDSSESIGKDQGIMKDGTRGFFGSDSGLSDVDPDAGGEDSSETTAKDLDIMKGGIGGFSGLDDGVVADPDGGGGIPFTCTAGTCTCDGSRDCLDMGRADVCKGDSECEVDSNKCSCTMKQS